MWSRQAKALVNCGSLEFFRMITDVCPSGSFAAYGRCIDSRSLQLRRELGLQQCSAAERTRKLEPIRDRLQHIVRAKCPNRCIERMRMRGNLYGSFALRFEKRVTGKRSANGIGHRFASTTVQIDAGIVITSQNKRIVGRPKRSGKHIGETWLASAIASVAFGH